MSPCRLAVAVTAFLAFAVAPLSPALAAQPIPGQPAVALVECSTGKQPSSRVAVFRGSMASYPGTQSMRLNFRLRERIGSSRVWKPVRVPALEVLHTSQPGVAQFAYNQRIDALQPGTSYRVSVNFEWLGADGKPFAHATLRSKTCRQPGKLPNLQPYGEWSVNPGPTPDTAYYRFQVRNTGLGVARGVELRLLVDGAEIDVRSFKLLRSRQSAGTRFVGPACRKLIRVEVDPRDRVREISEKDNVWRIPCPAQSAL